MQGPLNKQKSTTQTEIFGHKKYLETSEVVYFEKEFSAFGLGTKIEIF